MSLCNKCGDEAQGKSGMCKPCRSIYNQQHYQKNKTKYKEKALKNKKAMKQKVREIKESLPCMDCKTFYPYYVMDFDHREDKEFNVSSIAGIKAWSIVLKEINKCDIVCSNCHRIRTYTRAGIASAPEAVESVMEA